MLQSHHTNIHQYYLHNNIHTVIECKSLSIRSCIILSGNRLKYLISMFIHELSKAQFFTHHPLRHCIEKEVIVELLRQLLSLLVANCKRISRIKGIHNVFNEFRWNDVVEVLRILKIYEAQLDL